MTTAATKTRHKALPSAAGGRHKALPSTADIQAIHRKTWQPSRAQVQMVEVVRHYRDQHDHGPSLQEIGAGLGIRSKSDVLRRVRTLVAHGSLTMAPGEHRSIDVGRHHVIAADFPDHLFMQIWAIAQKRGTYNAKAVVIELCEEALQARNSNDVSSRGEAA